ncbi:unnamed protein product [Agarophyton chilense]
MTSRHRQREPRKASINDRAGDSNAVEVTQESETEEGIINAEEARLKRGKKYGAKLYPKFMRIRFVNDYAIRTGLLEAIDLVGLLRDHMVSSTSSGEVIEG